MRSPLRRIRAWWEELRVEGLALQGETHAQRIVVLCAEGRYDQAAQVERHKLNPIQRELGQPESHYAADQAALADEKRQARG